MSFKDDVRKAVRRALLLDDEPEKNQPEKPNIPVSQRICPICLKEIGFDTSFISIGDTTYHVACVDELERLERGEK